MKKQICKNLLPPWENRTLRTPSQAFYGQIFLIQNYQFCDLLRFPLYLFLHKSPNHKLMYSWRLLIPRICQGILPYECYLGKNSTAYALIQLYDKLSCAIDQRKVTLVLFIDLSKAFDTQSWYSTVSWGSWCWIAMV